MRPIKKKFKKLKKTKSALIETADAQAQLNHLVEKVIEESQIKMPTVEYRLEGEQKVVIRFIGGDEDSNNIANDAASAASAVWELLQKKNSELNIQTKLERVSQGKRIFIAILVIDQQDFVNLHEQLSSKVESVNKDANVIWNSMFISNGEQVLEPWTMVAQAPSVDEENNPSTNSVEHEKVIPLPNNTANDSEAAEPSSPPVLMTDDNQQSLASTAVTDEKNNPPANSPEETSSTNVDESSLPMWVTEVEGEEGRITRSGNCLSGPSRQNSHEMKKNTDDSKKTLPKSNGLFGFRGETKNLIGGSVAIFSGATFITQGSLIALNIISLKSMLLLVGVSGAISSGAIIGTGVGLIALGLAAVGLGIYLLMKHLKRKETEAENKDQITVQPKPGAEPNTDYANMMVSNDERALEGERTGETAGCGL